MTPYLVATALAAIAAALFPQRRPDPIAWILAFVALVIFVGLRHKVGMDWNNYLAMIDGVGHGSMWDSIAYAEPAYAVLLWASANLDMGIYGANLVGAVLFCFGLFRFARTTPSPWLALTAAMPFLVIVVAMSANRQAVAIGVLLWLVAIWPRASVIERLLLIAGASMFHYSAAFFFMFVALDLNLRPTYKLAVTALGATAMIVIFHSTGTVERYDAMYVSGQSELTFSPGAHLHVLLNAIPASLLFLGDRARSFLFPSSLYRQMAWLALALIPLSLFASTVAGRMTLYLFPVSMYVFSALPKLFRTPSERALLRAFIGAAFLAMAWYWLTSANSSRAYIPYRNALTVDAWDLHL